jgi:hypothetical protein
VSEKSSLTTEGTTPNTRGRDRASQSRPAGARSAHGNRCYGEEDGTARVLEAGLMLQRPTKLAIPVPWTRTSPPTSPPGAVDRASMRTSSEGAVKMRGVISTPTLCF